MRVFNKIFSKIIFFFFPVNSIALVKPEKAKMIENTLIQMATTRQLGGKVLMYHLAINISY